LVDRLRGQYHLPVNDGAGPLNGSMTFSREFETPPIQHEAADTIEQMRHLLLRWVNIAENGLYGERTKHPLKKHPIVAQTLAMLDAPVTQDKRQ
jgi:hypothetical protein